MRTRLTKSELLAASDEQLGEFARWFTQALWPNLPERVVEQRVRWAITERDTTTCWLSFYDNYSVDAEGLFSYDKDCCGKLKLQQLVTATPPPFMLWPK